MGHYLHTGRNVLDAKKREFAMEEGTFEGEKGGGKREGGGEEG